MDAGDTPGEAAGGILWRRVRLRWKVAVVLRTRHGPEWSLPKGHRRGGEPWEDAALREVEEETGWRAAILDHAGTLSYPTEREGLKEVRFWTMRALCQVREVPGRPEAEPGPAGPREVIEVAWLAPKQALCRLTHSDQARLLAEQLAPEAAPGSLWERLRSHVRLSADERRRGRQAASIRVYRAELAERLQGAEEGPAAGHLELALALLAQAEKTLRAGDLNGAWQEFFAARYHETFALGEIELARRAEAVAVEAEKKLGDSWRGRAVSRLLGPVIPGGEPGKARETDLDKVRVSVAEATRILDEHFGNVYRRLDHVRDQLATVGKAGFAAFIPLVTLLATGFVPVTDETSSLDDAGAILGVVLFGILGGSFSAALSLLRAPLDRPIPEVLSSGLTTVMRPIVGGVGAIAAYAFLQAGILDFDRASGAYAVAFAAGFSERLVARAAESIGS
jgi:8-oxo-dGTP pyrophosphatase MutT (NUDIX family)